MKSKQLHQPFELYLSDLECWRERTLIYHFFEIVQIIEGSGTRVVNRNKFPYSKGSIFIFTPLDCRGFISDTPTRFCSIRFSEVFLGQCRSDAERNRITTWLKQLEHIFSHHNRFQEVLIRHPGDCQKITGLIENVMDEYGLKHSYYEENLKHFVTLILNIVARNISDLPSGTSKETEPLINRILLHIHQHISNPDKLRIGYLASHFNLADNYVGEYFKKITGESLQRYIMLYKINLVRQRLASSSLTVSEIAGELGFTDESHLGRQFRKYSGVSPLQYRKSAKSA